MTKYFLYIEYYNKNNKKFMLITKEIKVHNEIIPIEKLSKGSHKKIVVKCDNCKKIKEVTYYSYNNSTNNNTFDYYCNNKECINKKRNLVIQEKYNIKNVSQLESVKLKKIKTTLDNYGVKYPTQSSEIKNKIKNINNEKYGKDWITQTDFFKEKSKITNLEKYGVENAIQSDVVKNKIKNTCLSKYGLDSYMKTKEFRESLKQYSLDNHGVEYPSQSEKIQDKIKNTNINKYGFDRPSKSVEVKNKISQSFINNISNNVDNLTKFKDKMRISNLEKYNSIFYSQSETYKNIVKHRKIVLLSNKYNLKIENIIDGIIFSKCEKCNNIFDATYQQLYNRFIYNITLCTKCNPIDSLSESEIQLQNFIKENYTGEIILNDRKIIGPYELDIYIPELKIAFEFNGLYWHSELYKDKKYHITKTEKCEKLSIQLIHIFEDDWNYKQDIIKSIILNKLNKSQNKIYARKCEIKEIIDNRLIRDFLNKNHIQGYVNSEIKLGLFYNDELISIMTFGRKRKIMNFLINDNEYEMYRFCNKLNFNVIGGISKLFSYFIKKYSFSKITSYSDRSYFNGNNYLKIGFKMYGKTEPNYYYIINKKREYRFNFRKDILVKNGYDKDKTEHEIMLERGIYRIYNSGNFKFIYEK